MSWACLVLRKFDYVKTDRWASGNDEFAYLLIFANIIPEFWKKGSLRLRWQKMWRMDGARLIGPNRGLQDHIKNCWPAVTSKIIMSETKKESYLMPNAKCFGYFGIQLNASVKWAFDFQAPWAANFNRSVTLSAGLHREKLTWSIRMPGVRYGK